VVVVGDRWRVAEVLMYLVGALFLWAGRSEKRYIIGSQRVRLGWYRSKQTDRGREISALLLHHGNVHNPTEMVQREALSDVTL